MPALAIAAANVAPPQACGLQPPGGRWNETALWIAGKSDSAFSASLTGEQYDAWNDFAQHQNKAWARLGKQYLEPIANWRSHYLPNGSSGLAFYPFGGPDVINLLQFYPEARDYVTLGLEPVGCIPASISDYSPQYFAQLQRALSDVVTIGFFITENMRRNVTGTGLHGVLPLLLFLISRAGYTVTGVTPIAISPDGIDGPRLADPDTFGVAIQFADQRHGIRRLRYYSIDLTDSVLKKHPGAAKFLRQLPETVTLVKAASYLMYRDHFSTIRSTILAKSRIVVEEDSGVPYHFFSAENWDVHLFGSYSGPIPMFAKWRQADLRAAYAGRAGIPPLDFSLGYQRKGQANLLLAFRKRN